MLQALYASVSGIQAHQTELNVIGSNIANVNTTGYKGSNVNFEDQLYQTIQAASAPNGSLGGTNPGQVGSGVLVAGVAPSEAQGTLQSTGNLTDMAIQGSGYFMVTDGTKIYYTRDGTFSLDADGELVTSSGLKLVGYQADTSGNITPGGSVTAASTLSVPLGALTSAQATSNVALQGNLDATMHAYSTAVDLTGNLDSSATSGTVTSTATVYDEKGNPFDVNVTMSNPTDTPDALGAAAGATREWDVNISYPSNGSTVALGAQKLYLVNSAWTFLGGTASSPTVLGSVLNLDGAPGDGAKVGGDQTVSSNGKLFALALNFGQIGNAVQSSSVTGTADGASTVPTWSTKTTVYDSLGAPHDLVVTYTHSTLQDATATPPPPKGAVSRWDWQATEDGSVVAGSSSTGDSPIYFGSDGQIISGADQTVSLTSTSGSTTPVVFTLDGSTLTQLASTSDLKVSSQDGYGVGTLQSFSVDDTGTITGTFSSGQSRTLGQIALATFANPAGLQAAGGNLMSDSLNSGAAQVGPPNASGRGKISSGYLETSNVDLSTQLTNMIVAQRGFEANTRLVTVVDTLLQDVLNLGR